jgi:hypothetical protein
LQWHKFWVTGVAAEQQRVLPAQKVLIAAVAGETAASRMHTALSVLLRQQVDEVHTATSHVVHLCKLQTQKKFQKILDAPCTVRNRVLCAQVLDVVPLAVSYWYYWLKHLHQAAGAALKHCAPRPAS